MRSLYRTVPPDVLRNIVTLAIGDLFVGASFGAIAVAAGTPWWIPCLMSLIVFAGGAQFLSIGVIAAGGGPIAAVVGGLLLNARHLPFGLAIADVMGRGWLARLIGAHLLIDETTAFALAAKNSREARGAYWACGIILFVLWNLGTLGGALVGTAIGDTDALGLDAAFPAALLALVLPSLRHLPTLRAALIGGVIAVATTPFLPGGVPVLLALAGLAAAWPSRDETRAVTEEVAS